MNIGQLFSKVASGFSPQQEGSPASNAAPQPLNTGTPSSLQSKNAVDGSQDATNLQQGTPQGGEGKTESPLAEFSKLFVDDPKATPETFQLLNADPAKISEVAGKINFTSSLNPELVKKALGGDINAFLQVINGVGQQSFATAMQASSALVDRQSSSALDHMKKTLPDQFKQLTLKSDLQAENPQFSNPAIQPILEMIQQRLARQYPEASVADLKVQAKKFFAGAVEIFAPGAKVPVSESVDQNDENAMFVQAMRSSQKGVNDFDWDGWATGTQQKTSPTT